MKDIGSQSLQNKKHKSTSRPYKEEPELELHNTQNCKYSGIVLLMSSSTEVQCKRGIKNPLLQSKLCKKNSRLCKVESEWEQDIDQYYKLKRTVSLKFGSTEGLCKSDSLCLCQLSK